MKNKVERQSNTLTDTTTAIVALDSQADMS